MNAAASDEIMGATRRALCEHGYAGLTMQDIADESSMTTAAIHYHFDTKADLLNAFLVELIERFERRLVSDASDPCERLAAFLGAIFVPTDERDEDFPIALMELKSQAPYQEPYRERFVEMDRRMREVVTAAVRDGIDAGQFETADPERVARTVVTMINGSHARGVALGEAADRTREVIETYLELQLGWAPEVPA